MTFADACKLLLHHLRNHSQTPRVVGDRTYLFEAGPTSSDAELDASDEQEKKDVADKEKSDTEQRRNEAARERQPNPARVVLGTGSVGTPENGQSRPGPSQRTQRCAPSTNSGFRLTDRLVQ
jgi:hypothetical protein